MKYNQIGRLRISLISLSPLHISSNSQMPISDHNYQLFSILLGLEYKLYALQTANVETSGE